MRQYLIQRLLLSIPVVLCVTAIVFSILHLTPGDPVRIMAGSRASEERLQEIRLQLGLEDPIAMQYVRWLGNTVQGDLGSSIALKRPVAQIIGERLGATLRLTLTSLVVSVGVGVPLGMIAAMRHKHWQDHVISYGTLFGFSIPSFWLGLMLILIFGIRLQWTPISGYQGAISLILPTLTLASPQIGSIARVARTEMLEVLNMEYLTTARSKGLPPRIVYARHALRNAVIPVATLIFLSLPWLFGGAVIVETIFAWPGMGRLMYDSLLKKDFPLIQGLILVFAILTVVSNIVGDIVAARLDPRTMRE